MGQVNFPAGKLPPVFLSRMLKQFRNSDPQVLIGPALGEDAAVLKIGGKMVAVAVDPVTFLSKEAGFYAVVVNANDIATRGARPRWFLCSALFPEKRSSPSLIKKIFSEVERSCRLFGVSSIGGHTEITSSVTRPVLTGIMLGEVLGKKALSTSGVCPGDDIILTKSAALEAASVIAREKKSRVQSKFGAAFARQCEKLIENIGVVKEALAAYQVGNVHAMHDPTEGGLSSGLYEMAEASRVRIEIEEEKIPVLECVRRLLDFYGLNALGALSSGALLIASPPQSSGKIVAQLSRLKIPAVVIGRAFRGKGVLLKKGKRQKEFPRFSRDEIARFL